MDQEREIGSQEFRATMPDVMEDVRAGTTFIITTFGRPRAILLSVEEYRKLKTLKEQGQNHECAS